MNLYRLYFIIFPLIFTVSGVILFKNNMISQTGFIIRISFNILHFIIYLLSFKIKKIEKNLSLLMFLCFMGMFFIVTSMILHNPTYILITSAWLGLLMGLLTHHGFTFKVSIIYYIYIVLYLTGLTQVLYHQFTWTISSFLISIAVIAIPFLFNRAKKDKTREMKKEIENLKIKNDQILQDSIFSKLIIDTSINKFAIINMNKEYMFVSNNFTGNDQLDKLLIGKTDQLLVDDKFISKENWNRRNVSLDIIINGSNIISFEEFNVKKFEITYIFKNEFIIMYISEK